MAKKPKAKQATVKLSHNGYAIVAIILSVGLTFTGFNSETWAFLAFAWMLPVIIVLPFWQAKQAFLLGWLWFLLVGGLSCLWLYQAAVGYLDTSPILLAIIYLMLWLWLALPFALFAFLYHCLNLKSFFLEPFLAAALLTVIWVYFPSPFPGLPLHGLSQVPKFIAVLDISGISTLVFLSALFSFIFKNAIFAQAKQQRFINLIVALAIPLAMWAYGELRHWQIDKDKQLASAEQWLKVGYIQPNVGLDDNTMVLFQLTEQLIRFDKPDLLVWPELATSYSVIDNSFDKELTFTLVNHYKQDMLVASSYVYSDTETENSEYKYYSQVQMIDDGEITASYSKQKLVPFFEYIPNWLAFLKPWIKDYQLYLAGENQSPLPYKEHVSAAVVLCYEMIFPHLVRDLVKQGANIIINPTSDRNFDDTAGSHYHLFTAQFQQISHRLPWIRATNTGISTMVGADGQVISAYSPKKQKTIAIADVYLPTKQSLYTVYGDSLSKALLFLLIIFIGRNLWQKEKA